MSESPGGGWDTQCRVDTALPAMAPSAQTQASSGLPTRLQQSKPTTSKQLLGAGHSGQAGEHAEEVLSKASQRKHTRAARVGSPGKWLRRSWKQKTLTGVMPARDAGEAGGASGMGCSLDIHGKRERRRRTGWREPQTTSEKLSAKPVGALQKDCPLRSPSGAMASPPAPLGLSDCLKLRGRLRPGGACWVGPKGIAAGSRRPPAPPPARSLLKADLSRTHPEPTRLGCEEGEGRFPLVGGQRRSRREQHRQGPRGQETRGLFGNLSETEAVSATLGKLRVRAVCWGGLGLTTSGKANA